MELIAAIAMFGERLTAMGIEPLGALEGVPKLVEKRQIKARDDSAQGDESGHVPQQPAIANVP